MTACHCEKLFAKTPPPTPTDFLKKIGGLKNVFRACLNDCCVESLGDKNEQNPYLFICKCYSFSGIAGIMCNDGSGYYSVSYSL